MAKQIKVPSVIGARVLRVRMMTQQEADAEGWEFNRRHGAPTVIELDNGLRIYAMQDEEGNGPGVLVGRDSLEQSFYVTEGA